MTPVCWVARPLREGVIHDRCLMESTFKVDLTVRHHDLISFKKSG